MQSHTPALLNIEQAAEIVKSLDYENRERSTKNSRILTKYNSERPYDPVKLRDEGLHWRSNFSTKPLASLIDKVVPRFVSGVEGMKYLTAAKLPDSISGAAEKSEAFQKGITELCRSRETWGDVVNEIAQENTLFGYCAVGWTTRYEWMPRAYTQDNFLIPQGTKHTAGTAQIIALRETFLIHELFDLISKRENATLAGWDVDACILSLNEAKPEDRRSGFSDVARIYNDLYRESSVITSFVGAKVVSVWHVFVAELDGRVTHVAFDSESKRKLFWKNKQFDRMADVAAFFSFQHGNGKIHGSKGIGRELYALATVLDKGRNEVVDRLIMSGKLVISCDEKQIKRFRMSVVGGAILIGEEFKISQTKLDGAAQPYLELDEFLTKIIDDVAGSTSPQALQGDRVTKAATELNAGREEEKKDAVMERFFRQFAKMMSTIQRRASDPGCVEPDALEFQKKMLAVMSPEELAMLAAKPAVETVKDFTDAQRQAIVVLAGEAKGNPLYNAREMEYRKVSSIISAEFADAVLLPNNDPTEQAEQTRQQMTELLLLQSGQKVPVSSRDNHIIHLGVMHDGIQGLLPKAAQDPTTWTAMGDILQHCEDHVQAAQQGGMSKQVAPFVAFVTSLRAALQKLVANEQEAQAQGHPQAGLPSGAQPAPAAPPPQAPPPPPQPVGATGEALPPGVTPEQYGRDLVGLYPKAPDEIKRQVEAFFRLHPPANPTPTQPAVPPARAS